MRFSGSTVTFSGVRFSGGRADFIGARFSDGSVDFRRAQFSGSTIYFYEAQFSSGTVDFNSPADVSSPFHLGSLLGFGSATGVAPIGLVPSDGAAVPSRLILPPAWYPGSGAA
ncbi:hypothetical protein ACIQI8_42520 [Streptomyces sp. NPDC092369]|uniref:hypothetical protein n=1 Tax=Streptomyces sp. NPDC092369 TaxID=3366015 RepID=UPI0037FE1F9E